VNDAITRSIPACAAAVVNLICVFFGVVMTLTWQGGAANFQYQSGSVFLFFRLSFVYMNDSVLQDSEIMLLMLKLYL
jgi:hypothetical protein